MDMNALDKVWIAGQPNVKRAIEIAVTGKHNIQIAAAPSVGKSTMFEVLAYMTNQVGDETITKVTKPSDLIKFTEQHFGGVLWIAGEYLLTNGVTRLIANALSKATQILFEYQRCPCGYFGHSRRACLCTVEMIELHQRRVSASFMHRIHIQIEMEDNPEGSQGWHERKGTDIAYSVSEISAARQYLIQTPSPILTPDAIQLLDIVIRRQGYNVAQINNVKELAATIAALDHKESIMMHHIAEALQYQGRVG